MILIATYDSDKDTSAEGKVNWQRPMPQRPQFWFVRMIGDGANDERVERQVRPKGRCGFHELKEQVIIPQVDEMQAECGGVVRFQFWVYKAR